MTRNSINNLELARLLNRNLEKVKDYGETVLDYKKDFNEVKDPKLHGVTYGKFVSRKDDNKPF